ncbi:MAG: hypothetical protein R8F63_16845 [Acidimicrobiales bacterium]|nr:hypothetical protein [Acidimicrobiales bacterium]
MPTLADLPSDVAASFAALVDGVWDGRMDPTILEACRQRACALIGAPPDAGRHRSEPEPAADTPATRACLAFTEVWVIDPHAMTDELAAEVRRHLGDAQVAAFTIGLATIEAQARAALALGRVA